jgi:hypothetical protein
MALVLIGDQQQAVFQIDATTNGAIIAQPHPSL